jgi:prolyl oligopeptidase
VTLLIAVMTDTCAADGPPAAPIRAITDTYFGTAVVDNYRYMENLKDPEVQAWMEAQAGYTRRVLDRIPGRAALAARIQSLLGTDLRRGAFRVRGERLFYFLREPGAELPKLAYRDGINGSETILFDPASVSTDAVHHFSLDWYSPSNDGRYVAYGVSEGGSEKSVLRVLDVTTGKDLDERIERTQGCIVSWRLDNHSFFYFRFPKTGPDTPAAADEYNARTYLHKLGEHPQGEADEAVFGRGVSSALDVPEGQGTYVLLSPDSKYAVAVADHNMDNGPKTFYVVALDRIHGAATPWRKWAGPENGIVDAQLHGDRIFFLTLMNAPRFSLVSTRADHPDFGHAEVVMPQGAGVLDAFAIAGDGLYVSVRAGATFELKRVGFDGHDPHDIKLPFAGAIYDLVADHATPGVMFNLQSWIHSAREMTYNPNSDASTDTGLRPPAKTESNEVETREEFAVSYDGTPVPVSILLKKGTARDASRPTIVYGYGSYGISMDPIYDPAYLAWIERGGTIVIAHMRGGGEYGDAWHKAGQKLWKINTILDFNAAAQYMIDQHWTKSEYLAANAASAGGIVMGGAIELSPSLFRVVLDDVGISDTLRFETEANGPPNAVEFGSISSEEGFHGLFSMSAYAHVHDGTPYPAVMFTTGANDGRVSPWHMMKMAARVQTASSSGRPVLLRIDYDAGHGIGSSVSQQADELADEWSFALWQMGEHDFQTIEPRVTP